MRPVPEAIRTRRAVVRGGFTLIESIAVISIVAILAAISVPSLVTLTNSRAALAARQALHDLTFARQRAIATGTRHWVSFDVNDDTWTVLQESQTTPGRANATVVADLATGRPFVQQLGTAQYINVGIDGAVFDGGNEIGFDWRGEPLNVSETPLALNGSITVNGNHLVTVQVGTGFAAYVGP